MFTLYNPRRRLIPFRCCAPTNKCGFNCGFDEDNIEHIKKTRFPKCHVEPTTVKEWLKSPEEAYEYMMRTGRDF